MSYECSAPLPAEPYSDVAPFYIEAVVVCDHYDDFLGKTLPHNKYVFDKIVVVTSPEDRKTQRICEYWHVSCIQTDELNSRWRKFCKGAGINAGLSALEKRGWVAHLDADILLPPTARKILDGADLDPTMLYGIDRFTVRGFPAYADFMDTPRLQQENNAYVHLNSFPLGTRVMHDFAGGYVPLGFFQMWHPGASGIAEYPTEHTNAGRGDTVFAQNWPRRKRALIPEIVGYHLESDDATMAANWNGRQTAPFTFRGALD